ncbi:MAG: exodeoxyribonuclease VII small subunit [Spirochaetales bacterium]|nr:exodeoxyribonuclease VII small subunit [Spirochaetales bacterium]
MKQFEQRLERLEEISELLQSEDIKLHEAVSLFEEGMKLAKGLDSELKNVEQKIEILTNDPEASGEQPQTEAFSPEEKQGDDNKNPDAEYL